MAFNAHAKSAERCITRHKRCPMAHREKTKQKSENESWVRSDIPSFCGRHYAAREKIDLVRAIAGLEKNEKEITDQKILLPIYPTALNLRTHPCDTEAHQRRTGPVQKKKQRIETSQLDHEDFMNPRCSTSRCVWAHCLSVPLREKVRKMRKQKEKNKKKEQPSLFPLPSFLLPSASVNLSVTMGGCSVLRTAVAVRRQQAPPDTGVKMSPYYPQFRIQKYYGLSLYVSTPCTPEGAKICGKQRVNRYSAIHTDTSVQMQWPSDRPIGMVPKSPDCPYFPIFGDAISSSPHSTKPS